MQDSDNCIFTWRPRYLVHFCQLLLIKKYKNKFLHFWWWQNQPQLFSIKVYSPYSIRVITNTVDECSPIIMHHASPYHHKPTVVSMSLCHHTSPIFFPLSISHSTNMPPFQLNTYTWYPVPTKWIMYPPFWSHWKVITVKQK